MASLPKHVQKYAETPVFTEESVPKKLTSVHDTKEGVWGRLIMIEGQLDFVIPGPPHISQSLQAENGDIAIIEPQIPHYVDIKGPVTFKIEFLR